MSFGIPCTRLAASSLAVLLFTLVPTAAHAGEMEPPAPPGPTMKPLNELEARRPIFAEMLPLTITEWGSSWYLAENITTSGGGIQVDAEDVTIDLNGFRLEGGTGHGIYGSSSGAAVTIRNGAVRGWAGSGIHFDLGIIVVENVVARWNGGSGIHVGHSSRVSDCTAGNNSAAGILTGGISMVVNCDSGNNGANGIETGDDSRVIGCIATINVGNGIYASSGSLVSGCTASDNNLNGIRTDSNGHILNNTCISNSEFSPEDKAGVFALGHYNRIEGNHLESNAYGIRLDGVYNTVVRNTATLNSIQNFFYVTPNDIGPIGTAATATSPWANLCQGACP